MSIIITSIDLSELQLIYIYIKIYIFIALFYLNTIYYELIDQLIIVMQLMPFIFIICASLIASIVITCGSFVGPQ